MGIARSALQILLQEGSRRSFSGAVLTLGKQDIWFNEDLLRGMAAEYRVPLMEAPERRPPIKAEFASKGFISDHHLFSMLGFDGMRVLDFSDYEGADTVFDLNSEALPDSLLGQFDAVIDGGTIEHIFHVPNVLNNIFKMLKVGGRIIHLSPSSNHIDHGFYMFSPTLFWDYYYCNGFEVNTCQVGRYIGPRHDTDLWQLSRYQPGCLDQVSIGGLDNAAYMVVCVATKGPASTGTKVPQQGMYAKGMWNQGVPTPEERIGSVVRALQAGDMDSAEQASDAATQAFPQHPLVWRIRAKVQIGRCEFNEAIASLGRALGLDANEDTLLELYRLYVDLGLEEEAGEVADYLQKGFPEASLPRQAAP